MTKLDSSLTTPLILMSIVLLIVGGVYLQPMLFPVEEEEEKIYDTHLQETAYEDLKSKIDAFGLEKAWVHANYNALKASIAMSEDVLGAEKINALKGDLDSRYASKILDSVGFFCSTRKPDNSSTHKDLKKIEKLFVTLKKDSDFSNKNTKADSLIIKYRAFINLQYSIKTFLKKEYKGSTYAKYRKKMKAYENYEYFNINGGTFEKDKDGNVKTTAGRKLGEGRNIGVIKKDGSLLHLVSVNIDKLNSFITIPGEVLDCPDDIDCDCEKFKKYNYYYETCLAAKDSIENID